MYKGTKVVKDAERITIQPTYDVDWQKQPVNVPNLLAGLLAGQWSRSLKPLKEKMAFSLKTGAPLNGVSLDLEAFSARDEETRPDKIILVAGMQKVKLENFEFSMEDPKQIMAYDGLTSVDVAKKVYDYCDGQDFVFGHYIKYDIDILRNYEPLVANNKKHGKKAVGRLPLAAIDLMSPVRNMGISASQNHIAAHYSLGTQKISVNNELWQHTVFGEKMGLPMKEIRAAYLEIRDQRNRGCLAQNIAELAYESRYAKILNRFTVKEVYPNRQKMEDSLSDAGISLARSFPLVPRSADTKPTTRKLPAYKISWKRNPPSLRKV
jgi:hypothetical protein